MRRNMHDGATVLRFLGEKLFERVPKGFLPVSEHNQIGLFGHFLQHAEAAVLRIGAQHLIDKPAF